MKHIIKYKDFINEAVEQRTSAGLAIIYQGKVLLAHTAGRKFSTGYGIPKGGVDPGETLIKAARRETREEVGIKVPKALVDTNGHVFTYNGRKWGYFKTIHWFVVEIEDLSQIGLKDLVVPKGQLQLKEINDARFMDLQTAKEVIMPSQQGVLTKLVNLGLIS